MYSDIDMIGSIGDVRELGEILRDRERIMKEAADKLEFEFAAILQNEIMQLEKIVKKQKTK